MNIPVLYALNFILVSLESVILSYLASGFFMAKVPRRIYVLSVVGLAIVINIAFIILPDKTIWNQISFITLNTIWIYLIYRKGFVKSFFVSLLTSSYLFIVDVIIMAIAFSRQDSSSTLTQNPYVYYHIAYSAKIVELFGIVVIRYFLRRVLLHQYGSWTEWARVLFYPFAVLAVSIILNSILFHSPNHAHMLFSCLFILLLTDFLSVFLLDYLEHQQEAVRNNSVLKQNLKLASDHVRSLEQYYEQQRKLTHDFKNHLSVIKNLAETGTRNPELLDYLDRLIKQDASMETHLKTNRLIADLILNQKISEAISKQITVRTQIQDLSQFPLPDEALVVVLSNLLDNAIEACERIQDQSARSIQIKMLLGYDTGILSVENTTASPVIIRDQQIISTKEQPHEHGFGIKNICTTLDRYNATYTMDYLTDSVTFCFIAQIPIKF